jgi:hypothetical protein
VRNAGYLMPGDLLYGKARSVKISPPGLKVGASFAKKVAISLLTITHDCG